MEPITPHNQQPAADMQSKMDRINKIVAEFSKETDRGLAVLAASMLDQKLKIILSNFLLQSKQTDRLISSADAPIGTFSARLNMAYALGLISEDEYHDSDIIRRIRNEFAHVFELEFSFANPSVSDRCKNMRILHIGNNLMRDKNARTLFLLTAASLEYRWFYREEHAQKMRLQTPNWEDIVYPIKQTVYRIPPESV